MNSSILITGLNHTTAPIQIREGVACTHGELVRALPQLVSQDVNGPLTEGVILSTCNRTEVYVVASDPARGEQHLRHFFEQRAEFSSIPLAECLYTYWDRDAVGHLLSVACGLDSMIIGEFEILGQVRSAYELAMNQKTIGPILTALFHAAIHTGKRARSETAIGHGATSVAYAAVRLAQEKIGSLENRSALVIGTGEMGQRVAKNLRANGVSTLLVTSRTHDHAITLAHQLGGSAVRFEDLSGALASVDVVISATGAPHTVLPAATIERAMAGRPERALCIIDIAVPRDVDPAAAQILNVHLFDLDDLQEVARENIAEREKEVIRVRAIIAEEEEEFWRWYLARRAAPVIARLRERAEAIRVAELDKALRRLGHLHLSERDRNVIIALSEGIVNKLLAAPVAHLKEHVQGGDSQVYLSAVCELFELQDRCPCRRQRHGR